MSIDTKRLRELANAATPGPWEQTRLPGFPHALTALYRVEGDDGRQVADCYDSRTCSDEQAERDAAFIAAAHPQAVVALVDEVERLRALVRSIDETLRVSAAEYVPAISDVFSLIDKAGAR